MNARIAPGILGLWLALAAFWPASAQTCNPCPGAPLDVGMCGTPDIVHAGAGCSFNYCQVPQVAATPAFDVLAQGDGTATVRMRVLITAPWNQTAQQSNPNGTLDITWFDTPTAPTPWTSGGNPSLCEYLASDRVNTYVEKHGLTCGGAPYDFGTYSLRASMCGGPCTPPFFPNCGAFCGRWIDKGGYEFKVTKEMLNCPKPKKYDCDSCTGCFEVGGGSGGPAGGRGGASAGGGPGWGAPGASGPGAMLRYAAGGVGGPGFPGSALWNPILGRYWSHDYAERIVLDAVPNDDSHVWLLTDKGTFREFSKAAPGPGPYTTVTTGDEYRKLARTASGWDLQELDGTVRSYDANGRWFRTADPHGNAKQASYDPSTGLLSQVTFPDGRHETFAYTANRLTGITEVGSDNLTMRTWTYVWTGDDLIRIVRPGGTKWEFTYGDTAHPGYLTRMELVGASGARRVEAAWEYDAAGNAVKLWRGDVSYAGANAIDKWSLSFDNATLPAVTTITDPMGKVATYNLARDAGSGKPKITSLAGDCPSCGLGPDAQLFYEDPANPLRVTRMVDGRGTTTLMSYDANGLLTSKTEASGTALERITTYQRGGPFPALITRVESPSSSGSGVRAAVEAYDGTGNRTSQTITGVEAGSAFSYTKSTTYNTAGRPTLIDPPGYAGQDQSSFTYDPARGNLVVLSSTTPLVGTTTYAYDAFNRRISTQNPNGEVTDRSYDPLNRKLSETQRGLTPAGDLQTVFTYDELGDLAQVQLPRGNLIAYGYDGNGRLTSIENRPNPATPGERIVYTLDGFGHRTREELQRWSAGGWVVDAATDFIYSSRCHLDKAVYPGGKVTEYAYDCVGNLEKVWDAQHPSAGQANPPSSAFTYDLLNRRTASAQPWGGPGGGSAVTSFGFDVQGHPTTVTDPNGNITQSVYSDRDVVTQEISPATGTSSYTYNEHLRRTGQVDGRGISAAYSFDAADRTTFIDYPDNALDVTFTYDDPAVAFSKGQLTALTRNGQTLHYTYDRFGRTLQDGGIAFAYDANGNVASIAYPGALTAAYSYDFADRPAGLTLTDGSAPAQSIAGAATYAAFGPLTSLALGNALNESRAYDQRYFPTSLALPGRLDWSLSTDGLGDVTGITDNLSPGGSRTFGYQDFQYYLTQGDGPWGTRAWTYDKLGNRLTETHDGVTDSYSLAGNGSGGNTPRLIQIARGGGGGTSSLFYDAAGELTYSERSGDKLSFSYAADSSLAQIRGDLASGANAVSRFEYDGRGYLSHSTFNPFVSVAGTTYETTATYASSGALLYRLDAAHRGPASPRAQAEEQTGSALLYFGDRPVAIYEKKTVTPATGSPTTTTRLLYLTTDLLGAPVVATDAAGAAVWSGGFEPFGRDWNGARAAGIFQHARGQWDDGAWDGATLPSGLSNNLFRWYSADTGRYSQPDPIGLRGGLNPYLYAGANPIVHDDPLGLCQSGSCADCPGGSWWSGAGVAELLGEAGPVGAGGVLFAGIFLCTSNPTFNVPWVTVCGAGFVGPEWENPGPRALRQVTKMKWHPNPANEGIGVGGGVGGAVVNCSGYKCREDLAGGEGGTFVQVGPVYGFRERSDSGGSCTGGGAGPDAGFYIGRFQCKTYIGNSLGGHI